MRYDDDAALRTERQRERERERRIRERDPASVLTPGVPGFKPNAIEDERDDRRRAAELADLERQISAKRHHAMQLERCAGDDTLPDAHAYVAQHQAAEAEVKRLEARAAAIRAGSPL